MVTRAGRRGRGRSLSGCPRSTPPSLTRRAGADNLAVFSQYVAVLGSVEDAHRRMLPPTVEECRYERFSRFLCGDGRGQRAVRPLRARVPRNVRSCRASQIGCARGILRARSRCGSGGFLVELAASLPEELLRRLRLSDRSDHQCAREREPARVRKCDASSTQISRLRRHRRARKRRSSSPTFDAVLRSGSSRSRCCVDPAACSRTMASYLMQDIKGSSHIENNRRHPIGTFLYTFLHALHDACRLRKVGEGSARCG